ncbi:hypothetical protein XF35_28550 [Streptomyces platensis subsp. clarensis]|nr:hypothetical protein [Streptomyces platensis subsp. clarensis]
MWPAASRSASVQSACGCRPSPVAGREIYEIAAERAGVATHRCLFVDDRLENVEAAIMLGMTGVHYRAAAHLREMLGFLSDD